MTIRRQLFCSPAYFCKRTLTYLPPPFRSRAPHVGYSSSRPMAWRGRERLSNPALWVEVHVGKEVWGGSYSLDNCRATEELAPNRHQIISVPLYIPYSFMHSTVQYSRSRYRLNFRVVQCPHSAVQSSVQCNALPSHHSTVQHSTVQHSTAQNQSSSAQ